MAIIDGGLIAQQIFDRMAMQVLMISENEHICNTDPMVATDSPWAPAALAYGQYYDYMHNTLPADGDAEVEADLSAVFGNVDATNQTEAYVVSKLSAAINAIKTHCTSRAYGAGAPAGLLGTTPSSFNNWLAECEVGGVVVHREFARAYALSTGEDLQARNVFIDSNTNLLINAGSIPVGFWVARTLQAWAVAGTTMSYNDMDTLNTEQFARGHVVGMGYYTVVAAPVEVFEMGNYLQTTDGDQPGRQAYSEYDDTIADAGVGPGTPTNRCEYAPADLYLQWDGVAAGPDPTIALWDFNVTTVNPDGTTQIVPVQFPIGTNFALGPDIARIGAGQYVGVTNITNPATGRAIINGDTMHVIAVQHRDINL